MKYSGPILLSAVALLVVLSHPSKVNAETNVEISNNGEGATSNVDVHTNTGGNTICVNGKCTTSGENNGKSTVCINGKCQTSTDGDLHVTSEDGKAKVNVDHSKVNVGSYNQSTKSAEEIKKEVKDKIEKIKNKLKAKKASTSAKKSDMEDFFNKKLEFLRKLVTFQFLFGDK